jgi:glycerophosphoryl diester phosphodiesterase
MTGKHIILFLFLIINCSYAQTLVIAHRGASSMAPENTLASVKKAIELGVDIVEVDVHLSSDSQIIVCHDENLKRTTGRAVLVKDISSLEIKKLDAGSWFSNEFKGEKIPLLEEVIKLVNGKCKLLIEIKKGSETYPGIELIVLELIKKLKAEDFCLIHTFAQAAVFTWDAFNSTIPISYLKVSGPLKIWSHKLMHSRIAPDSINCFSNNYYYRFVTKRFVRKVHANNQKIFVWTINNKRGMRRMIRAGVDGIITNKPDILIKYQTSMKSESKPK